MENVVDTEMKNDIRREGNRKYQNEKWKKGGEEKGRE